MSPRDATRGDDEQRSGAALVATSLVLIAVFVPTAFLGRDQRAVLPAVRADDRVQHGGQHVRLADALPGPRRAAAPAEVRSKPGGSIRLFGWTLGWFFRLFDAALEKVTGAYAWGVRRAVRFLASSRWASTRPCWG